MSFTPQPKVPLQPLIDALADRGIHGPVRIGRATGLDRITIRRAIKAGELTVWSADIAASRLGIHPVLIWGDEWLDQDELNHPDIELSVRIDLAFQQLRQEVAS